MRLTHKYVFGNIWFGFNIHIWADYKKTVETIGIQDICCDGLRVLFLEYDEKLRYDWLIAELKRIQQEFKLSNIYIFESSKDSYHCFCMDKLTSKEINTIVDTTSADYAFRKNHVYDYVSRVLRIAKKGDKPMPKYLEALKSDFN